MRKHILPALDSKRFAVMRGAFWGAALLSSAALLASSPAAAQFACTVTATDSTCTNTGNATTVELNNATGINQNATTTNSGTAVGFASFTEGGGNATATNSGTNGGPGLAAETFSGGNATVTNSGSNNSGGMEAFTQVDNSSITITNSGSNGGGISASTQGNNSSITITNSGSNTDGIGALTLGTNSNITVSNSGSNPGGINVGSSGNATVTNSGSNGGFIVVSTGNTTVTNSGSNTHGILAQASGNATATNSGTNSGGITALAGSVVVSNSGINPGGIDAVATSGNAVVNNSGSNGTGLFIETIGGNAVVNNSGSTGSVEIVPIGGGTSSVTNSGVISAVGVQAAIEVVSGPTVLTDIVGGRVIGAINLFPTNNTINFVGGNWLFTFNTLAGATINTNGAPFVVSGNTIAVLDPTSFALADRALTNFTGEVQQMLQGRFDGMFSGGVGGSTALGFAGAPSTPGLANEATQAFSGIPSVAMSYASDSRPVLGKAPAAAAPYYDTTVWASGFGGERKQNADGVVLPATDIAYGGALGVDRAFGPNLRLGAFAGGGASREDVEFSVQSIDSTYAFGGGYGRLDWVSQYLDFSLYGGSISNSSTRGIANNTVASGFETATASYGGWFISPALTYGYRIPLSKHILMMPRVSVRYVGGALDGYSESCSEQDLSVGRRSINDLEERAELEFSTLKPVSWGGTVKSTIAVGAIGLERLGNQTIDTVLLGQNLSFVTPGQASAGGGVVDAGIQYRPAGNVSLFISAEGTAMSDRSYSGAATGGARVAF
jgi:hypothetical protein